MTSDGAALEVALAEACELICLQTQPPSFRGFTQFRITAHSEANSRLRNKSRMRNCLFSFSCDTAPVRTYRHTDTAKGKQLTRERVLG
jgi:hypothetical protein